MTEEFYEILLRLRKTQIRVAIGSCTGMSLASNAGEFSDIR